VTHTQRSRSSDEARVPVLGRFFPSPAAAKVPEVILLFWVVKILTTAGGEVTSDYLKIYGNFKGGGVELALFVVGLVWLGAIFAVWYRREGTLSIHSITTQRREAYYWATVFATFALGTALGDYTATTLGLGFLSSAIVFSVVILLPAVAHWRFGLNGIAAFWMSYVVTRPLGASYADYISKPRSLSGINFGNGPAAVIFAAAVFAFVAYLAIVRPDIQRAGETATADRRSATSIGRDTISAEPELELD
jgi:uncharacterized membrane-anchored protein